MVQPANGPRGSSAGTNHGGPQLCHFLLKKKKKKAVTKPGASTLDPTDSLALKKRADVVHPSIYACFVLCVMLMIRAVMMMMWKH